MSRRDDRSCQDRCKKPRCTRQSVSTAQSGRIPGCGLRNIQIGIGVFPDGYKNHGVGARPSPPQSVPKKYEKWPTNFKEQNSSRISAGDRRDLYRPFVPQVSPVHVEKEREPPFI
jgi:hypothetical protein